MPNPAPPSSFADPSSVADLPSAADAAALRRELAMERVRRRVFESVAREELLAHTLQCLVDMVEREAPRLSAGILFDPHGQGLADAPLSDPAVPMPVVAIPDDAPIDATNALAAVAGRLGTAAVAAAGRALTLTTTTARAVVTTGATVTPHAPDGHRLWVPLGLSGSDAPAGVTELASSRCAWVVPLYGGDRCGRPTGEEDAGLPGTTAHGHLAGCGDLGALLILADDLAPPTPAERALVDLAAELAAFAVGHRRQAAQAARRLMLDPLTGLPNGTLLADRLAQAVEASRRQRATLAVLLVDVDGLRAVNESAGRAAGDAVLRQLADRLRAGVRRSDSAARPGGGRFAVVAPVAGGRRDAVTLAKKVLALFAQPVAVGGRDVSLGASVGVGVFPDDAPDAGRLLHAAEVAVHRAKRRGRNALELFQLAAGDTTTLADLEMEGQLRRAIEVAVRAQAVATFDTVGTPPSAAAAGPSGAGGAADPAGTLALHYQPQVDPVGRLLGVEALARWTHPTLGRVPPDKFVAVAEQSGLIVPFGAWALREAVDQARRWADEFGPAAPRVAVNVSAVEFAEPGFADAVERLLALARLKPGLLELEITETMLMRDADAAAAKIARLRAAGLSVALDDFGTGYSSLAYLHRLTLDTLKVDRAFVSGITGGDRVPPPGGAAGGPAGAPGASHRVAPGGAAVTRAIVSMGRSLGMSVLAEGVETEAQRHLLTRLGCDRMQGYLFSPPVPAAKIAEMLLAGGVLPQIAAAAVARSA